MRSKNTDKTVFFDQDCDQIDKEFEVLLSDEEKRELLEILSKYNKIRMDSKDYFFFIAKILNFIKANSKQDDVIIYAGIGIIPSQFKHIKFNNDDGFVIGFDSRQIEKFLHKSRCSFSNAFLKHFAVQLTQKSLNLIFSKNEEIIHKITSIADSILTFQRNPIFYFIKSTFFSNFGIFVSNEKFTFPNEPLKNNVSFLIKYQQEKSIEKEHKIEEKKNKEKSKKLESFMVNLKKFSENANSIKSDDSSSFYEATDNFDNIDLIEKAEEQIQDISNTVTKLKFNEENALNYHKKGQIWPDVNILKFGFLIKYCSESAYRRLYFLLDEKIPPPSTIDSHFHKDIINREKVLTNPFQITEILDQYWTNNLEIIQQNLIEYNKFFNENETIDEFKIHVCVGCDAASLTSFYSKERKVKSNKKLNLFFKSKEVKSLKEKISFDKNFFFNKLINGDFITDYIPNSNEINENNSPNFITYLLQPLNWHFPIIVIKLTKSESGSITLHDALDINIIFKVINDHPHFKADCFAADGTKSLSALHRIAFDKYSSLIPKVVNNTISIDQLISKAEEEIAVFPILDMLHSEKTARDKISDHQIKLGENVEIIDKNILKNLDLPTEVLNDLSNLARMNDFYALKLFTIKNTKELYEKNLFASGLYFLIYSLILEIFRNPFIHIISRSELSKLVLYLLILIYCGSFSLPSETSIRKSDLKYVWFGTTDTMISLINTMVVICRGLKTPKLYFCLGIERYSSHPDEQFFGRYRDKFIGFNIIQNAFRYAVRASLALDFEHDLNVCFTIPKRSNFGGVHLNFIGSNGQMFDVNAIFRDDFQLNIQEFASDVFNVGTGKKRELQINSKIIIDQLYNFFSIFQSLHNGNISKTKGISIVPRLIGASQQYKQETCLEKYEADMKILEKKALNSMFQRFGYDYNENNSDSDSGNFSQYDSLLEEEDYYTGKQRLIIHEHNRRH